MAGFGCHTDRSDKNKRQLKKDPPPPLFYYYNINSDLLFKDFLRVRCGKKVRWEKDGNLIIIFLKSLRVLVLVLINFD